jgi:hypothetical protein
MEVTTKTRSHGDKNNIENVVLLHYTKVKEK